MKSALSNLDILVVDDDVDGREMVEYILAGAGARVRSAGTGGEALRSLESCRPAVLLADISLPDFDGYVLLEHALRLHPNLPAIALTGHASRADERRALDAGYSHHLSKPLDLVRLMALVSRFAPSATTSSDGAVYDEVRQP